MRSNIPLMSKYCYLRYDPNFSERARKMGQSIIIGGENYGQGSSREHAAINPMYLGVRCVIAKSIARIHRGNLINHGIVTRVKTNGLLLNEEAVKRFQAYRPFQIDISLYGCDSESYVAVTGVDAYEQVVRNIRLAIEAGLHIQINITPSSYMSPWTEQVMQLAKSFNVSVMVNDTLIDPYDNTGRKKADFDIPIDEELRIERKRREMFSSGYSTGDHEFFMKRRNRPVLSDKGLFCDAGRSGFAVNWDGVLLPCLAFPRDVVCAHPLRDGFRQAWSEVNEAVKNYEIPKACHSCELNDKCHYCPVHHQKVAAKHQCDPDFFFFLKAKYKATQETEKNS